MTTQAGNGWRASVRSSLVATDLQVVGMAWWPVTKESLQRLELQATGLCGRRLKALDEGSGFERSAPKARC